ncbi:MAG: hypothetical protein KY462_14125 [Actinobacteria bacterium]|nr:hypothetical protein [Actinomycetota bacterium]
MGHPRAAATVVAACSMAAVLSAAPTVEPHVDARTRSGATLAAPTAATDNLDGPVPWSALLTAPPEPPEPRVAPPVPPAADAGDDRPRVSVHGPAWLADRAEQVLQRITYPWRSTGFTIEFGPARTGLRALFHRVDRRIEVFVRRGDPVAQTAFDLAHEIGHAVDVTAGSPARRAAWLERRGAPESTPWYGCSGCDDLSTGAGDFAEVFALWQLGDVDFRSRVAPPPSPGELDDLSVWFWPPGRSPSCHAHGGCLPSGRRMP